MAGDMAAPVSSMSGASTKTTPAYVSCWSASYGWEVAQRRDLES
jgi:hypothetical protein